MANEMGHTFLGIPARGKRWEQLLNLVLLTGSAAATLVALTILVATFWWLYGPAGTSSGIAAMRPPQAQPPGAFAPASEQPPAAAPARPGRAAAAPPAAPAAQAQQPVAGSGAQNPMPPAAAGPRRRGNKATNDRDAEMTHGIAQGLHQLARDPDAARKLGAPGAGPQE